MSVSLCQGVEGHSYRKAEMELAVLYSFNSLQSSQRSHPREDSIIDGSNNIFVLLMS